MKVHAPWKLEDEGGHSFLPCISHPRKRMLECLAYLPSCHWCSSSFTQLLITSVTQGPSVFSIRSTHRAKTPPDHVDPQHKESEEGGFPSVKLVDQELISRVDALKANKNQPSGSLRRASGESAEPDTQFYEGLDLETD